MDIYLLRHGDAGPYTHPDALRSLSQLGREQIEKVLSHRSGQIQRVDQLWVSPYVRAQQTADLVDAQISYTERLDVSLVTPESHPQGFIDHLYQTRESQQSSSSSMQSVFVVTHNPFVSYLVSLLCGQEPGETVMGTGSLAKITADPIAAGCAELVWLEHA